MFSFFTIITSVQYGAILLDHRVGTFIGRIRIRVVTWTLFRCRLTIVVALIDVVFFIVVVSMLNCDDREINRLIMITVRHCCTVQYWMQRQDVECISYTETIPTLLHNESKQRLLYSCRLYVASNFNCRIKLGGLLKIARNHVGPTVQLWSYVEICETLLLRTTNGNYEVIYGLLNSGNFDDLEWPSRSFTVYLLQTF